MRSARVAAVLAIVSCGRIHFNARTSDASLDGPSTDAAIGNPAGCADGKREGFVDQSTFPTIAGCGAVWMGSMSLRTARFDLPCGDDGPGCLSPADACAVGWHICADTGDPIDLTARITVEQCLDAGGDQTGPFVAASSHCTSCAGACATEADCTYGSAYGCLGGGVKCSESPCCGAGCNTANICKSGIFAGATRIHIADCGVTPSIGVLCCVD